MAQAGPKKSEHEANQRGESHRSSPTVAPPTCGAAADGATQGRGRAGGAARGAPTGLVGALPLKLAGLHDTHTRAGEMGGSMVDGVGRVAGGGGGAIVCNQEGPQGDIALGSDHGQRPPRMQAVGSAKRDARCMAGPHVCACRPHSCLSGCI
jgi:hypothetical protein